MRISKLYYVLAVIVLGFACGKKKYPESSIENEPVFSFIGNINYTPTNIQVGVNDYYLYSSFKQDSNNVYGFYATIKQTNCNSCVNTLQVQINDSKISALNSSVQIDSALHKGFYPYLAGSQTASYSVQFQSAYNKTPDTYYWSFGDGYTSTEANPMHIYKPGRYNACLTINGTNSCVSRVCSFQRLNFLATSCRTSIADSNVSATTKQFYATTTGTAPFTYFWTFGDGNTSVSSNPSHTYLIKGSFPVSLRVIDANNDTAVVNYNTVTQNDLSSCAANYKVSSITPLPNSLGLSGVIVSWVDAAGMKYTSNNTLQPSTSKFEIISVSEYQNNENGQQTKKIHIKFSCMLYNGSVSVPITNAEAIISLAYK